MAYNEFEKLKDNIKALMAAFDWQAGKSMSPADFLHLQKYAGFGGIKTVLYPKGPETTWVKLGAIKEDMRMYHPMMGFHELLENKLSKEQYAEALDSLKNSSLTAFYTPGVVPRVLYEVMAAENIFPKRLYEPSAGAGIFITEAVNHFPGLQQITAVEKDLLTGRVLEAINSYLPVPSTTHITGFEKADAADNATYDLIVSNVPFGNIAVQDDSYADKNITGRIHNYFVAKGLEKVSEGGLMAYVISDVFINKPANQPVREYLFQRADFISLAVLPDNLMQETGGTLSPSHLLIVQKNSSKEALTAEETRLIEAVPQQNELGEYFVSGYILDHPEILLGNDIRQGKNQYGSPTLEVRQKGGIEGIGERLRDILTNDIRERLDKTLFLEASQFAHVIEQRGSKQLTFLPTPEAKAGKPITVQMGLFDIAPVENINRALAYVNDTDAKRVLPASARVLSTIKTTDRPDHESIALITAKEIKGKRYLYKLVSNVEEIRFTGNWLNNTLLARELKYLSSKLQQFDHRYNYSGDLTFQNAFGMDSDEKRLFSRLKQFYKPGTLFIYNGSVGTVTGIDQEQQTAHFQPFPAPFKNKQFYERYIALRDTYLELNQLEEGGVEYPGLRQELNEAYNSFNKAYGLLNTGNNKKLIYEDEPFGLLVLSSLERKQDDTYIKADILDRALTLPKEAIRAEDPTEALSICLNERGKVDLPFISRLTGMADDEIIQSLHKFIYLNPSTNAWETADDYLSGNVIKKLKEAEEIASQSSGNIYIQNSLEAIRRVQPEPIAFDLLDFNLGERWIPTEYYSRFATHLFRTETTVHLLTSIDVFKVQTSGKNAVIDQEYAINPKSEKKMYGNTLLEHALENTAPFFTYEVKVGDSTIRRPDNEAIQLAHQKIESIRQQFGQWLQELPAEDKNHLETLYNETYNCYVLREYNGSHLRFPGLDFASLGIPGLYPSQTDATWRIIQNRGGLIDHEPGLGKTLIAIAASQEMKRLGLCRKPAILALKANVGQITREFRKAYPKARVLAPGKNDFTPAQRRRIYFEIMNNEWDCIILTHDQFKKIPHAPEIQKEILTTELHNLEKDLETLADLGGDISKKMLKGLERRKETLEANLKDTLKQIEQQKDADIDFKKLGIDHLFVDESHEFKNLTFTTRHNRVAGLGNTEGSQKALNMLFAVRTLQERFNADYCATFLSGTPITNSISEMYLLFKYLRPRELERRHMPNFDAWAAVHARKTTDFEFSITNEIITKERFRIFIKVPELVTFYNQMTDYKTAKHINLQKPSLEEVLVNLKPTPDQEDFMQRLIEFARTGDGPLIGRLPLTKSEDDSRMLIAMNYAKKVAADPRLISPDYEDHPNNKINTCARNITDWYHKSNEYRGTQAIFSDIGVPKEGVFNLYDALKEKLVRDFDIPAGEITFIHHWADDKKNDLFTKLNAGVIRIVIGSTRKLGTGANFQERVVAMHHLDIPLKPAELDQRNARGARQGNTVARNSFGNKVISYYYAVEQSLDNFLFNLVRNKSLFINQIKNNALHVRTIDEGAIDEKGGMSYNEYIAILSGDTTLLEKAKLEKKITALESVKGAHFRDTNRARYKHADTVKEKERTLALLEKLSADEACYRSRLKTEPDGTKCNPIQLQGIQSGDPETIGLHLINLYKNHQPADASNPNTKIGTVYGFDLYIRSQLRYSLDGKERTFENDFYAESQQTSLKYFYNYGQINIDNPKLAARYFLNAIDRVTPTLESQREHLKHIEKELPLLEQIMAKPFDKEAELRSLKDELAALEREMAIKIQQRQLAVECQQGVEPETAKVIDMGAAPKSTAPVLESPLPHELPEPLIRRSQPAVRYLPGPEPAQQAKMTR